MAAVGEDVHLSCQLMQSRDVLQVMWQKLSPEGKKKDLGTYNKYFGQTVNDGFQGKVEFKDAGLQNCSIVIRKVMEQDEGCYLCLFNTYPDGSLTGRTCLQLYELHEPILQIRESNSNEETVVSCSATGRPAPTVILNVPQQDLYFSHNSTVSVTNTNGTVTVTTTAVLSGFHGNGAKVGCAARLLSVPEIQVFKTIPADELHEPILQIRESNSTEETVVSCSATGRPAPTVTLNVPQQDLYSHNSTVSVTNTNGTVTVTTTAVLSGFHGNVYAKSSSRCIIAHRDTDEMGPLRVGFLVLVVAATTGPRRTTKDHEGPRRLSLQPRVSFLTSIPSEISIVDLKLAAMMTQAAVMTMFFILGVFPKGLTAVIQTQQTVMAAVGEDVHLSCQLMQSRDVRQVTWQKLSPDGKKKILASYNKASGQEVIPGFQGKVEFKDAGLQHCSIVIRKVMEQDEGCYLCLFNTYPDGSLTGTTCLQLYGQTADIQTQQTVMAAVGEDVHLSCQLMQSRDVLQVTWQKLSPDGKKKNLGSCDKNSSQTVNDGFQGKVEFKDAGLQNCSIVIRKVMEQDEGCYLCLFNTFPDGSLTGRTCLQLYELHEPILQIRESNSTEETVVSCSATGRPAPTVTLNVPQQDLYFSHNSTVSVTNTNSTVTVTTTAVLSGLHGNGAQVGCAARLLSVPEIQVFMTIPADGFDDESGSNKNFTLIVTLITAVVVVCVAVVVTVLLRHKQKNSLSHRDAEEMEMTQEPIEDPDE
ncbi:immunoglobulin superfamily member 10-like [Thunnus thynnus]|uniref:immunoglobulin superfamily member 10-like n=1 Tax=Thunnus thynnus TaxID=8237 RepID=UPI003528E6FF